MNERMQRYLDGEIGLEALSPELRREAEAWRALLSDVEAAGAAGAPAGVESRVLRAVRARARRGAWSRLRDWWLRPRPVRLRPVAGAAAVAAAAVAAAVVALVVWPGDGESAGEAMYVQFVLEAPDARSVAVAGDFSGWVPAVELEDPDGDGIWSGRARLAPGVHKYMFVIDGTRWVTDPFAERYSEDGFGHRNAVLAIMDGGGGANALAP